MIRLLPLLFLVSCAQPFFGGYRVSEYRSHYDGKMICARISGWYKETKCMCFLTEDDPQLKDKTFLASVSYMCD